MWATKYQTRTQWRIKRIQVRWKQIYLSIVSILIESPDYQYYFVSCCTFIFYWPSFNTLAIIIRAPIYIQFKHLMSTENIWWNILIWKCNFKRLSVNCQSNNFITILSILINIFHILILTFTKLINIYSSIASFL